MQGCGGCGTPSRGWGFTPGGRIRKNETLAQALQRVARDELGLAPNFCMQVLAPDRMLREVLA